MVSLSVGKYANKVMSTMPVARPLAASAMGVSTDDSPFSVQRRFRGTVRSDTERQPHFVPVYVHHVSKIALEHLQGARSDWIMDQGLDNRLHINPNGTFVLSFPSKKGCDSGKIWTSYDASRKQHWLSVYRQKLAARFLMKDHGQNMTKGLHDSKQTETHIVKAVDQMISAVDQTDAAAIPRP